MTKETDISPEAVERACVALDECAEHMHAQHAVYMPGRILDAARTLRALAAALAEAVSRGDDWCDQAQQMRRAGDAERARRERAEAALRKLLCDITALMEQSGGVYGLHMNGDNAPWDEITDGGRFEGWLPLEEARAALEAGTDGR